MLNRQAGLYSLLALSALLYFLLAYHVQRAETAILISIYSLLFGSYLYFLDERKSLALKTILISAIIFRLIFLLSIPALSDDFYRFIWDGRLWAAGINPFAELPVYFMDNPALAQSGINQELLTLINSPTHYTVYPPIPQFINVLAAWLSGNSIVGAVLIMRIVFILAELGTIILLYKLLQRSPAQRSMVGIYALNPLIIIEITGNLHHEGLMIFFFIAFIYYFQRNKTALSAGLLAASVASKLIPLIILPYLFLKLRGQKRILFFTAFVLSLLLLFAPLLDYSFFTGMQDSLTLYYQKLEFNGGLYFVVREIGYWYKGYNIIASSGKAFAAISFILILGYSYYAWKTGQQSFRVYTWILMIFLSFSLILHPWYIAGLIVLSVFTGYTFPIVWSFFIFLTYAGYSQQGYQDTYLIIFIEYVIVFAAMIYDLKHTQQPQLTQKV